ncbi:unnamed protein product [Cunninghamella echinulata]
MTNTTIQHLEKQHESLKFIQKKNQNPKQTFHNPNLNISRQQHFNSNTTKDIDNSMKNILSISTRFIGNSVYVILKDGACFKGTLFNSLENDKVQLTLTMAEEIKNGETIGQIKNTLNLYGHEIIDIQAINTDEQNNTIESISYSKNIKFHSPLDNDNINNYVALDDDFEPNHNKTTVNIPNKASKKKEDPLRKNTSEKSNNNKVINVNKENSYRNNQYGRNEPKNTSIKKSYNNHCIPTPKYDQSKSFQKENKSNKQINKKQNYYNNNHRCYNNQYNEGFNKFKKNKKQPNPKENTNISFNKNKAYAKSKINYNEVYPYRYTMNHNNANHYSKNDDKKGGNQPLYNSLLSSPSTPLSLYYIPWAYSSLNNNHNNNKQLNYHQYTMNSYVMNDELPQAHPMNFSPSSSTSTNYHHITYFFEEEKKKKKHKSKMKAKKRKKTVEFKPTTTTTTTTTTNATTTNATTTNATTNTTNATSITNSITDHSIVLNTDEEIKTNDDKDNSSKLFINKICPSYFFKAKLPAPNKVDPIWPYGKHSFKLEFQPPLVYAVQDFRGYIHYLYPHCPLNMMNMQGLTSAFFSIMPNNESEQNQLVYHDLSYLSMF